MGVGVVLNLCLLGEIGRHSGLKIRPLGIVGSSPIVSNLNFFWKAFCRYIDISIYIFYFFKLKGCFFLLLVCFLALKKSVYALCFFYNVRFLSVKRTFKINNNKKGSYRWKPKAKKKPLSLRKRASGYNFRFKWFEYLTYFLSTLTTYENVNKFGIQIEKIVGREFLKEWKDYNKKKNKNKLWGVWRYKFAKTFYRMRIAVYKKKKFLSFRKRYRPWKQHKKQKFLTSFFYKLRKSFFFKRYAYRFKLLQLFFFRYTFSSMKLFEALKKKKNSWFWTSNSRYLHLEQYFRYQLYYFLKQVFFFKKRKQFSAWDWQVKIFRFKFKKLKILLGQKFLKINSIVVINPFYLVFLYDLIELSYLKFYEQVTSFKQKQKNFRMYKLSFFDRSSRKPSNFNFAKRIKKKEQFFLEKQKKKGLFSFFISFKKTKNKIQRSYLRFISKRLSYYKKSKQYFLYFFYFLPFFRRYQTSYKSFLKRTIKKNLKKKVRLKSFKFLNNFLKSRKAFITKVVRGLFYMRWRSQHTQWKKKKKKKNYFFRFYYNRKKKGKKKIKNHLRLGLGKFFRFFNWEQERLFKLFAIFFKKQWLFNKKFLKKKKRSTANRWIRKQHRRLTKLNSAQYFRRKKKKYYKHQYFIKFKRLSYREVESKLKRFWLFKKIWFFKQIFFFYKITNLQRLKYKKNNSRHLLRSSRLLSYIPFRVSRVVTRKNSWKSRFLIFKRKELQLLFFNGIK